MDSIYNISGKIVTTSIDMLKGIGNMWGSTAKKTCEDTVPLKEPIRLSEIATRNEVIELLSGSPWIPIAGIFGATAVAMGAYGAHVLYPRKDIPDDLKAVFETANKYHFLHALALIGVPLTRRPHIVGPLMIIGTLIFSGSCYIYALTERKDVITVTPYGGMTLICAWISMMI